MISATEKETLIDKDGALVIIYRGWYKEAETLYKKLLEEVKWEQKPVLMFGKQVLQPRMIASCAKTELKHTYSGLTLDVPAYSSFPQGKEIERINDEINKLKEVQKFNSCLLNYYRDGNDYISFHSDKEGTTFVKQVASLSLGSKRRFYLRPKEGKGDIKTELNPGDLCLMLGKCQNLYTHSVPKQAKVSGRISLTFRSL